MTALDFHTHVSNQWFQLHQRSHLVSVRAVYPPPCYHKAMPEQIWRLFSATFLHIGFETTFFVNMISLYFLGRQMEQIFGSKQFSLSTFLSGMMGNLFCPSFSPNAITAGASTALYGMCSHLLSFFGMLHAIPSPTAWSILSLLLVNLVGSVLIPGISLLDIVGGAVGGALLAIVFPVRGARKIYNPGQRSSNPSLYCFISLDAFYRIILRIRKTIGSFSERFISNGFLNLFEK